MTLMSKPTDDEGKALTTFLLSNNRFDKSIVKTIIAIAAIPKKGATPYEDVAQIVETWITLIPQESNQSNENHQEDNSSSLAEIIEIVEIASNGNGNPIAKTSLPSITRPTS